MTTKSKKEITFNINLVYAILKHIKYVPLILILLFASFMFNEFSLIINVITLMIFIRMIYGIIYYKLVKYVLFADRFKVESGVFSKKTDFLELYRVEDISTSEPFILRLFKLEHIVLYTNDVTTPQVNIIGVEKVGLADIIRKNAERMRDIKKVRVFES